MERYLFKWVAYTGFFMLPLLTHEARAFALTAWCSWGYLALGNKKKRASV